VTDGDVGSGSWLGTFTQIGSREFSLGAMPIAGDANNSCSVIYSIDDTIRRQNKLANVLVPKFADNPARTRKRGEHLGFLNQRITESLGSLGSIRTDV